MTPIIDGSNWELLEPVHQTAALNPSTRLGYTPIPPRLITVGGTNVVIVEMRSTGAKSHWWLAGSATRLADVAIHPAQILLPLRTNAQRKLKLGEQTLLSYPDDGAGIWTLRLDVAYYLPDISIYIWLYRGIEKFNNIIDGGVDFEPAPSGQTYDAGFF